jgi:GR25 family glycosyltransferase involved in LPS biosynthesis
MTYKNFRPMQPLSLASFPRYVGGAMLQAKDVLRRKFDKNIKSFLKTELPGGGYYLSTGWEQQFLERFHSNYGLPMMRYEAARSSSPPRPN